MGTAHKRDWIWSCLITITRVATRRVIHSWMWLFACFKHGLIIITFVFSMQNVAAELQIHKIVYIWIHEGPTYISRQWFQIKVHQQGHRESKQDRCNVNPQNQSFKSCHITESTSQSKEKGHPGLHKAGIYDWVEMTLWHILGIKRLKPVHVKKYVSYIIIYSASRWVYIWQKEGCLKPTCLLHGRIAAKEYKAILQDQMVQTLFSWCIIFDSQYSINSKIISSITR